MDIVIDFDGTCVTHEFPKIGKDIGAIPVLEKLIENGHRLILSTMRSDIENPQSSDYNITPIGGKYLTNAINWFKENKIPLYGININPSQIKWTNSPKAYGELYIDDSALGCPLIFDNKISNRKFVDWIKVGQMLKEMNIL